MGTVRIAGVKRSGGLEAAALSPLEPGGGTALYCHDARLLSLKDEVWHSVHTIRAAEGVSGKVRVSFSVWNSIYDDFETTFARVRVGGVTYPSVAASNVPVKYQQDVDIAPGEIIYIDAYCDGYGSSTIIENIKIGAVLPFAMFERIYV